MRSVKITWLVAPALRTQALLWPKCHPVSFTGEGRYDGTGRVASLEKVALASPAPRRRAHFRVMLLWQAQNIFFLCLKDEDAHKHIYLAKVMKGERKSQVLLFRGQGMALP